MEVITFLGPKIPLEVKRLIQVSPSLSESVKIIKNQTFKIHYLFEILKKKQNDGCINLNDINYIYFQLIGFNFSNFSN